MQLQSGRLLQGGKYRIERVLGQGGFGITYQAVQVALNRKVAIKEFFMKEYCNRDSETSQVSVPSEGSKELVGKFRQKFIKEAQNIAALNHPHIIRIYDVFEENGTAYYVMEFWDNGSLADLVKRQGALDEAEALRYIRQVADALGYIHERKMNHLDVKPGNILLDENRNAVLIDFGLSKRYDEEGNQTSTTPVGISHGYAPLEQYKKGGVGTFSPATDIYSLGATLYKLVTGCTPPDANDILTDGLPAHSGVLYNAIVKAMQPNKNLRPQSVDAFLALFAAEVDVKDTKNDEATMIELRQKKETDAAAKQQDANTAEDKGSVVLGCIIMLIGLAAICGLGYWGVKSFKAHRAEKADMAYVEQQRQDSIASIGQMIQNRQDSLEVVAAAERVAKKETERKRVEAEKHKEEILETVEPVALRINSQNIIENRNGYIKYENGTILDEKRKIMWMTKDYMSIEGHALPNASWQKAVDWCEKINNQFYAGYNDWRIPSVKELITLARPASQREFYRSFFEESGADYFWSNNSISDYVKSYVNMKDGFATSGDSEGNKNHLTNELFKYSVRLVRNID